MIRALIEHIRFARDHRFVRRHISEYVDGELGHDADRRVESHVGTCPECRRLYATLKRTLDSLRALAPDTRPGLSEGIIERLRHS